MIDPKKLISSAGYLPLPELEAAVVEEIERIASNPAMVDRLFKKHCRRASKPKRGAKSDQAS